MNHRMPDGMMADHRARSKLQLQVTGTESGLATLRAACTKASTGSRLPHQLPMRPGNFLVPQRSLKPAR